MQLVRVANRARSPSWPAYGSGFDETFARRTPFPCRRSSRHTSACDRRFEQACSPWLSWLWVLPAWCADVDIVRPGRYRSAAACLPPIVGPSPPDFSPSLFPAHHLAATDLIVRDKTQE